MTIKLLKEKSKRNLKDNKFQISFAFFLMFLVSSIILLIDFISYGTVFYIILFVFALIVILSLSYLNPGYYSMLLNISRNQKIRVNDLFNKSFLFSKSFVIEFFTYIFKALIYIPVLYLLIYVVYPIIHTYIVTTFTPALYTSLMEHVKILGIASGVVLVIFILIVLTYRMAYYFLLDNPSFSSIKCMRASRKMMHRNKFKLFKIYLSYVPIFLLVIIIYISLGFLYEYVVSLSQNLELIEEIILYTRVIIIVIAYIVITPKVHVTIANLYDVLKGSYSDQKGKEINNNFNNVYFNDSADSNVQNSGVLDNYNKVMMEKKKSETNEVFDIQNEGK